MLGAFDLTNCCYFVDTAFLWFSVINLSAVALLYLRKVLIVQIP